MMSWRLVSILCPKYQIAAAPPCKLIPCLWQATREKTSRNNSCAPVDGETRRQSHGARQAVSRWACLVEAVLQEGSIELLKWLEDQHLQIEEDRLQIRIKAETPVWFGECGQVGIYNFPCHQALDITLEQHRTCPYTTWRFITTSVFTMHHKVPGSMLIDVQKPRLWNQDGEPFAATIMCKTGWLTSSWYTEGSSSCSCIHQASVGIKSSSMAFLATGWNDCRCISEY